MSPEPRKRLLLGPQRPVLNLGEAFAEAGFPAGPVAVISAGWQEAEIEDANTFEGGQGHRTPPDGNVGNVVGKSSASGALREPTRSRRSRGTSAR